MADMNLQLVDQIKELNTNLRTISALVSNLSVQIRKHDCKSEKNYSPPTAAAPVQNTLRSTGYVNWNCSHDILKTKQWKELSIFTNHCSNYYGERNTTNSDGKLRMDLFQVLDEQTRFPKDELYINISNPLIRAEILYIKTLLTAQLPDKGLVERFLNVAKVDMHTRSSFEEKYGLTWVKKPQNSQLEQTNTPNPSSLINIPKYKLCAAAQSMQKTYKPKRNAKPIYYGNKNVSEEAETQKLLKEFTLILNQLNSDNFESSLARVNSLNINNQKRLEGVVDLIFKKAIQHDTYLHVYAALCVKLSTTKVVTDDPEQYVNFRGLLINKCQNFFETSQCNLENEPGEQDHEVCTIDPKKKDELKTKDNALGNIRFIGEMFKHKLLTGRILNYVLIKLTEELNEQNIESVCVLLINLGEHAYDKDMFGQSVVPKIILEKLQKKIMDDSFKISTRIKLLIQNVLSDRI